MGETLGVHAVHLSMCLYDGYSHLPTILLGAKYKLSYMTVDFLIFRPFDILQSSLEHSGCQLEPSSLQSLI